VLAGHLVAQTLVGGLEVAETTRGVPNGLAPKWPRSFAQESHASTASLVSIGRIKVLVPSTHDVRAILIDAVVIITLVISAIRVVGVEFRSILNLWR
jgi:hypothetical protein